MSSVEVAEQAGTETNEDVVLVRPNAVALLDGATALRPTARTGGWFASRLAEALGPRLETEAALAELMADSITEVSSTHELHPGSAPSSTVTLLRWDADMVEALVLADSPIIAFTNAGEYPITDDRLTSLRTSNRGGYRARLRSGGGFGSKHDQVLRESVDNTGRWRNAEGGFWIAEAVPEAAYQATRVQWPRSEIRASLILSDGVSCGVEQYGSYTHWSAMLEETTTMGPASVLDRVQAAEIRP